MADAGARGCWGRAGRPARVRTLFEGARGERADRRRVRRRRASLRANLSPCRKCSARRFACRRARIPPNRAQPPRAPGVFRSGVRTEAIDTPSDPPDLPDLPDLPGLPDLPDLLGPTCPTV